MIFTDEIVEMIAKIRKERKISQRQLGKGICSGQQISKLERGELRADYFLLEVLLQRLGRTPDKLEIVISGEEFVNIKERDDFIDDLRCGRIESAERHLKRFCSRMEKSSLVLQMNGYKMQGIYACEIGDYTTAEKALCHAAEISLGVPLEIDEEERLFQNFPYERIGRKQAERRLFSDIELEIFILLVQVCIKQVGGQERATQLLRFIHAYVREWITDEEQLTRLLPRIAVVAGNLAVRSYKEQDCILLWEEALKLLRKHGMFQLMTPLLEYLATACWKDGREQEARKYAAWKDTIGQLYTLLGLSVDIVDKLYFSSCVGQFYLTGEIIREERIARGLIQEQLLEGIYNDAETLSRVENGRKPDWKKQEMLFDKLDIHRGNYNGRVITDDYDLLELYSETAILLTRKEDDEAMWGVKLLRKKLDMSIPENQQIIESFEIMHQYKQRQISKEEALGQTRGLLQLTYHKNSRRVPFEGEALLMNQICILLARLGKYDEAIELQKKIIGSYEKSSLPLKYHFRMVYLIMNNMTCNMEHMGYAAETKYWSYRAMRDNLMNGKGNLVHLLLGNIIGLKMAQQEDIQLCKKWLRWAYHFTDIFMQYVDQKYLQPYASEHFGKEMEWY